MSEKITDFKKAYTKEKYDNSALKRRIRELEAQVATLLGRQKPQSAPPSADHYLLQQYYKIIRDHLFVWRGGEWVRSNANLQLLLSQQEAEVANQIKKEEQALKTKLARRAKKVA